jgi:hypothetical protein
VAELIRPYMISPRFFYIFLIFLLLTTVSALYGITAEEAFIDLDLWTEITETIPSLTEGKSSFLTENEIYKRTFEDAVWIISGMIYGFDVIYTPLDREREVDEYLEITPLASINWGDEKLEVVDKWINNGKLSLHVRYFLEKSQIRRLNMWESNIFPDAEGTGIVSIFNGHKGRIESIKTGIKEALRNYFRIRNTNKPREIRCRVLLNKPPYTILDAGGYRSKVNITIKITELMPYSFY